MKVRVLMEPHHGATYDRVVAMAKVTEEAGFDAFFRGDHYLGIDSTDPEYRPTDSWTTLAGVALETSRIKLGTLMTAGTFRHPGVVANSVATVDQMSGGRVVLGIGTGWYEREHKAFGIPFPPIGERFDRLDEEMRIINGLWTTPEGEAFGFNGKFWQLEESRNFPVLVQKPRPEIVIGGTGPRRTPLMAARYADEFNSGAGHGCAERFANVRGVCEEIGRDPVDAADVRDHAGDLRRHQGGGRSAARTSRGARRTHAGERRRGHAVGPDRRARAADRRRLRNRLPAHLRHRRP